MFTKTKFSKKQLLMTTLLAGAVAGMAGVPAFAQETQDEIVVTGSRIKKKDYTSNSPVATVDAIQFERTGSVNTENLLNSLPQVVPGLGQTSNNPGNGSATVDLRGIGANRTLVLVDGRRMVPFGQNGVVDLNSIPGSLIKNVEVLTGGASSVYGSDAVAGVINFIYKDEFEGLETNVGYQLTEKGDSGLFNADVTMGAGLEDGRGHVVMNVSYVNREGSFAGERDFAAVALFNNGTLDGLIPGGSSGVPGTAAFAGFDFGGAETGGVFFESDGSVRPFVLSGAVNDFYNYAPVNFLQIPQERFTVTTLGKYEINDHVEVYGRGSFASNKVDSELAPTPIFQRSPFQPFSLDGNPFLTDGAQRILSGDNVAFVGGGVRVGRLLDANGDCANCVFDSDGDGSLDTTALIDTDGDGIADTASLGLRRRLVEVGPRQTKDTNQNFQITIGARGAINDIWNYDVYFQEGRTLRSQFQAGNVNRGRFNQALLLADADGDGNVDLDANGNATCSDTSTNGSTSNCVPLNIFGAGNISQEAADFIRTAANARSTFEQTVVAANFDGNFGDMSFTDDPIGMAFGFEYIENTAAFDPSQDIAASTIAGFGGSPASGGTFDVYSAYGELAVPLIEGMAFADNITLDLAGRVSDYSTSGTSYNYKIGGEWQVNSQIRFRGNYNTATRAPNIGELFSPVSENFPGATDPCSQAGAPNAAVTAICLATGVPSAAVGSSVINTISGQVKTLGGGNPNLGVEKARTITFGAVLRPDFIEGLSVSIDYYDIVINDAISSFGGGANNVLSVCYTDSVNGGAGSPFCNVITRRADGSIDNIALTAQNVARTSVKGIDVIADYGFDTADVLGSDFGRLNVKYLGTYNIENDFVAFDGASAITCAGEFGLTCGEPDPTYRHRATLGWSKGSLSAQTVWKLIGSVNDDAPGTQTTNEIGTINYFDTSITWDVNDALQLTFGTNNVFDKKPPLLGQNSQQSNTYPATYDVFGRTFFANAKVRF